MKRLAWTAVALALMPAALTLAAAGPATASAAAGSQPPGGSLPVSIAITSITPGYVRPGKPVTVKGSVTNTSRAPITGMTVRLRSSGTPFANRDALQVYADGAPVPDFPVSRAVTSIPRALAPHATANWSITLRAGQLGITEFGVYPLAAEADSSSGKALLTSRTFLPYWPGKRALDPVRQDIAWIWPAAAISVRWAADQQPGRQPRRRRQAGRAARRRPRLHRQRAPDLGDRSCPAVQRADHDHALQVRRDRGLRWPEQAAC